MCLPKARSVASLLGRLAGRVDGVIVCDDGSADSTGEVVAGVRLLSEVAVPFGGDGKVRGVFNIVSRVQDAFMGYDVRLVGALANHATAAQTHQVGQQVWA